MAHDKLKVVIAEDHTPSRALIRGILETLSFVEVAGEAEDGEQLIDIVCNSEANVVLTDIEMPKRSGMDAARECLSIVPQLKIIFMTAYENFAVEAFNVSAVDYVVKPIEPRRLRQALERVRQQLHGSHPPDTVESGEHKEKLVLRTERSLYLIPYRDIVFIEKAGRKTVVHTLDRTFETAETLGSLLRRIGRDEFVQAHRSYILNLDHLSSIEPSGETNLAYFRRYGLPAYISKHKLNAVMERLGTTDGPPSAHANEEEAPDD